MVLCSTPKLASVRSRDDLLLKKKHCEQVKVSGQRLLRLVPTGYGKSLCYQLIPFLFDYQRGRMNALKAELSVMIASCVVAPHVPDG